MGFLTIYRKKIEQDFTRKTYSEIALFFKNNLKELSGAEKNLGIFKKIHFLMLKSGQTWGFPNSGRKILPEKSKKERFRIQIV